MQQSSFQPRPDPRPLIEAALERAIQLSIGKKSYPISDGRLVYEEHRRYRYAYKLEWPWDLADGTDLQLRSSDFDGLPVQLSNTKEDVVMIVVNQRLPDRTLDHAQLVVDRAYLLRKLKEALDPLKVSTTSAQIGLKLFGHLDCPDTAASPHLVEVIKDVFTPDDAQRLAIQRSLKSELLMLLGPPGTGKTDVLATIALLHALLYKHRVLISSHTNIAIDNAIIRLVGFIKKHGLEHWLDDQLIVRYGDPHLAELETDTYRNVTVPLIVANYIQQQREEIARLERRRDLVIQQLATDETELPKQVRAWEQRKVEIPRERKRAKADLSDLEEEEQQELIPIQEKIAELKKQDQQAKRTMDQTVVDWKTDEVERQPLVRAYYDQKQQRETAKKKVKELGIYKPLKRFWVQLVTNEWQRGLEAKVEDLATSLDALEKQILPIQERQATLKASYQRAEQRRKDLKDLITTWTEKRDERIAFFQEEKEGVLQEMKDLDQELQVGNAHIVQLEKAIERGVQERALIEDTLAHLDQQVIDAKREAARKVIEGAQVVGATLTGLYMNPTLLNQEWDVVIIDEGSMAPPPAVLVAANRARGHLIVVGDPLQLAPVCKLKDPLLKPWQKDQDLVQRWLGHDVFSHGGYTLEQAGAGIHHSVLLPYQSRMHCDICDLVRGLVYKGLLKDRTPHLPRPTFGPEPDHAVVLYDTGGAKQAQTRKPKSGSSRYNPYHAEVAIKLAWQALSGMPNKKAECIGIVTPYVAQREHIKELIQGTVLETYVRVGTIHAFQGLEFDVLIFDTVESPGVATSRFTSDRWGTDAMRLLNVAVSRARHKLLIVANMHYICQEPASSLLLQMLELACRKKCIPAESLRLLLRGGGS